MRRRTHSLALALAASLVLPPALLAQRPGAVVPGSALSAADSAAIRRTALDYVEGWYEGDGDRMRRALHPQLARRVVKGAPDAPARLEEQGAESLIRGAVRGWGTRTPAAERRGEIHILDGYEDMATVRADMRDCVDYLQLARWNGRWVIVNALQTMRPETERARAGRRAVR